MILNQIKKGGIDTSDATGTAADLLSGKTMYSANGRVTGIIAEYDGTAINVPNSALKFSSPGVFSIATTNGPKNWDGTLEYSTDLTNWTTWTGTSAISSSTTGAEKVLYIRGTNNHVITGSSRDSRWVLNGSNISCIGNIENLLDYNEVANGNHPTMNSYAFAYLFYNCTILTTAPALPATTLANYCYYSMFQGCTGIKLSDTQTGEYTIPYRIPTSGTGKSAIDALTNMFASTGGTFKSTPEINTTYYLSTNNSIVS